MYVVGGSGPPLFGQDWLRTICLNSNSISALKKLAPANCSHPHDKVHLKVLLQRYGDLLKDKLGTVSGECAELFLREDARPKFLKARSVPFIIQPAVEAKLLELEKLGIKCLRLRASSRHQWYQQRRTAASACAVFTRQPSLLVLTWTGTPFQRSKTYLPLLQEASTSQKLTLIGPTSRC